jgi:hypothetical protein
MMTTRRDLLRLLGASSLHFLGGCGGVDPIDIPPDATFDDVLDLIHRNDVEFGGGLANHAPMAAEALVALGLAERVVPYVADYVAKHSLPPFVDDAPLPADQRTLGDVDQRFAWIAAYVEELETVSAWTLAARELPKLTPGWAAIHGLLRIGHALRALERDDTPARRRELAFGLGYAAADYHELPGIPGSRPQAGLGIVEALAAVPLVPRADRVDGLILSRLAVLDGRADFIAAIEGVDLDTLPIETAIGELAAAAARLFVAGGASDIVYLHAITGTSVLRLLLPVLDVDGQRAALGYAFQAVAGAHAVAGASPGVPVVVAPPRRTISQLVDAAATTSDEHRIKLIEACLREHAIHPRPELLAAASRY